MIISVTRAIGRDNYLAVAAGFILAGAAIGADLLSWSWVGVGSDGNAGNADHGGGHIGS